MARRRGTYTLSSNIELEAGAPLDSRDIVQTKADLTNGSFPYAYVGMETYVISEGKKYRFIGEDPTDIEDWEEVGSGSSDLEFIEISEADYAELTTEEKNDPTKIYFRYEATGFFRDVQDDPNATAFQGTKIPTGRTVDSVVDGKLDGKADNEPIFTEASTRANIASGESIPTILGKVKKFFTDLKDLAFIGKDGATSTKFLRGDGTWQEVPTSEGTVTGVKVNGTTKSPVDGIVDIGTLATQDTNTTYTLSISGNSIVLTPSEGSATPITVPYATAAGKATTDADGNTISSTYFKNGVGNATDGTGNRLAPFKVVTETEYAALTTAQKNNGTIYFRTGANTPMRPVQDDGTATDLTSGDLPTGQTIKSYLNSNLGAVYRSEIKDFKNLANGSSVTASITIPLIKVGIIIYTVCHCGSNKSAGGYWEVSGLSSPYSRAIHAIPIPGNWDDTETMADLLVNIAAGTYTFTFTNRTGVATDVTYNSRVYVTVIKIQ